MAEKFAGIDVAKKHLDVHLLHTGEAFHVANDSDGWKKLVHRLRCDLQLIVVESTGGYEAAMVAELHYAGLPVAVVNPRQVRDFARATGHLAKTDRVDAAVLAKFAKAVRPRLTQVPDAISLKIKALVTRRRQLLQLRQAEKNHDEHAEGGGIARSIHRVVKLVQKELDRVDRDLRRTIQASPIWQRKAELLTSVPGIGEATAAAVLANMPELGTLNRRQVAALVGVAPINRDSGTLRGKRMIGGGRCEVRNSLYMPTLVAVRHNPWLRDFYQHLLEEGKAKKKALIACMRKLIILLNTIIRENRKWIPNNA